MEDRPGVSPDESEPLVPKRYPDSFEETTLESVLADLAVGRLVVVGAQTDECVRSTLHGALVRGYDATLVSDAHTTEDLSPWGAPPPELVIAHTNLYWGNHKARGGSAGTVEARTSIRSVLTTPDPEPGALAPVGYPPRCRTIGYCGRADTGSASTAWVRPVRVARRRQPSGYGCRPSASCRPVMSALVSRSKSPPRRFRQRCSTALARRECWACAARPSSVSLTSLERLAGSCSTAAYPLRWR